MQLNNGKLLAKSLLASGILLLTCTPWVSAQQRGVKNETIEASAMGTGSQMGRVIGVTLNIYDYSTPADRTALVEAFDKGKNQGLVNALQKMKAVGHVEITGTLGYDCTFIKVIPTRPGERFASSRTALSDSVRFGRIPFDAVRPDRRRVRSERY